MHASLSFLLFFGGFIFFENEYKFNLIEINQRPYLFSIRYVRRATYERAISAIISIRKISDCIYSLACQ